MGKAEGAEVITGGEAATEGALHQGFFVKPTLFANVAPEMRIAQEEIFGPVLSILPFRDTEEALEIASGIPIAEWGTIEVRAVYDVPGR